ncbi:MAG: hypothetical protein GY947_18905, partial [Rhodobacteraceae bacterium]|nr:hypothetical protein [Paracoccaceae bacterium]
MSLAEIEDTLRGLGDEDIVFYLSLTEDAKGERFDFLGALLHVSHTSNVPVYGGLESMAGLGVVGGYMLDARELGAQLGDMLSQILEGTPVRLVPLVAGSPHRYVFDFRQLARFEISHRDLPSHSQIIDEPDTFYYHYRNYFWAAAAVFCALLAYIAVLLSGIAKREKARRGLERLIDERDVLLSIDTPNKLLEQLRDRLLRVVPQLSEVSFLVSTGNPEAPFAPVVVQSGTAASAAPGPDLINLAQSSQVNTFARREALLHLSSPDVPADVVYCRSRRTLDPVDQRI